MNILLTGANGYIGKRLLPKLIDAGHHVYCCVRDPLRFRLPAHFEENVTILKVDLLDASTLEQKPQAIDAAYYLVHSMSASNDYARLEEQAANNFQVAMSKTRVQQVIYLSGIANEDELSEHLSSRLNVEETLKCGSYALTTLRAGIIIGSGSASFEIIRDLVEKLPVMITPKWLNTKCQPIAIADVITFLSKALNQKTTFDQHFDIGGPSVLTYKEMLLGYAAARGLKRWIFTLPVMTPKLSSYWLYFVTSTSYKLASALVDSMKVEVVCKNDDINALLQVQPMNYQEALQRTLSKIAQHEIVSSWKDSYISGQIEAPVSQYVEVPTYGCFRDVRFTTPANRQQSIDRIWSIGGENGWFYADWLWQMRGFIDKMVGGVGLRRGRTSPHALNVGDAVDFWRVLHADPARGRLLLFAEMKLPGEAWLEFEFVGDQLFQRATFRPKGLMGRFYWYAVYPFHGLIFKGMLNHIAKP